MTTPGFAISRRGPWPNMELWNLPPSCTGWPNSTSSSRFELPLSKLSAESMEASPRPLPRCSGHRGIPIFNKPPRTRRYLETELHEIPFGILGLPKGTESLLADLVHSRTGIYFEASKIDLLMDKLSPLVIRRGFNSFLDYYYLLKYDDTAPAEWVNVMNALSVGEPISGGNSIRSGR